MYLVLTCCLFNNSDKYYSDKCIIFHIFHYLFIAFLFSDSKGTPYVLKNLKN